MKKGDLVRIVNEWVGHNRWMKEMFEDEVVEVGLVVEDFDGFHHCIVLIGGKELNISKTRLEVVNG